MARPIGFFGLAYLSIASSYAFFNYAKDQSAGLEVGRVRCSASFDDFAGY